MSVRKDKNRNAYIAIIRYTDSTGKVRKKQKQFKTEREAKLWESQMRLKAEETDLSNHDITFENLAKQWIAYKREKGLSYGTVAKYENALRIAKDTAIYKKRARDIVMTDIESVLSSLAPYYTKSYIQDIKTGISSVFNFGIDQHIIQFNPCTRASLPKRTKAGRDNIDSFTKEEVAAIEKHYKDIPFGDVVYVMINTGLRTQEVCAINSDSIKIKDGTPYLIINKAMKRTRSGTWEVGETKTESSNREIPIKAEVYRIIAEGVMKHRTRLFIEGKSGHVSYENFRRHYLKFIEALNKVSETPVRYLPPHCERHTYSSRCEWSGISRGITKELLGHSDESQTTHYTHIMNKDKEYAIEKIQ